MAVALPGTAIATEDTHVAWQGIATTTASTSAQCAGVLESVLGDAYVSVFRPKTSSTDTNTYLSFALLRAAFTLENLSESTAHQMHGSGSDEIFGVDGRAKFFEGTGTYFLSISPAAITASTPVVTITGKISNFLNTPGCDVTFTGVYAKRVG
ncbi:MAG: hypothetical protein ACREE2_12680 [Stellaceae bacterium]